MGGTISLMTEGFMIGVTIPPMTEGFLGSGMGGGWVREWVWVKTERSLFPRVQSTFRWGRLSIINGSTEDFSRNRSLVGGIVTFGKYDKYRQYQYFPYERAIYDKS